MSGAAVLAACGTGVDETSVENTGISMFENLDGEEVKGNQTSNSEIDPIAQNAELSEDPEAEELGTEDPEVEELERRKLDGQEPVRGGLSGKENGQGLEGEELEAFIAARYEAYWNPFDTARRSPSSTPSVDHPALLDLASGTQLEQSYASVVNLFEVGEALRDPAEPAVAGSDSLSAHRVRVELVDAALANIVACTVADDERYNVQTDETVEQNVISVTSQSTMVLADGKWKIIGAEATEIESGVGGCWIEGNDVYPY